MTVQPATNLPHRSDADATAPGERGAKGAPAGQPVRPLLDCLVMLTQLHGRPASANALVAGLPLSGPDLTPQLFSRAATKAGFTCRSHERAIEDISALVLPAVLYLNDGGACLLIARPSEDRCEVFVPEAGGVSQVRLADLQARYSGKTIFVKPAVSHLLVKDEINIPTPKNWFFGIVSRFWPTYGEAVVAAGFVNVLALAVPLFTMNVYDRVIPNQAIPTLWVLALGVTLALTFDFALRGVRAALIDNAGRRADILLSARIFNHVMGMKMSARPASTGAFASQLREFETVRDFFTSATLASITDLLFVGLFIVIIWMIAGPVALVPACAVPIVLLVGATVQFPLIRAVRETQVEAAQKHAVLVETVANLETVKTLGAEGWRQRLWERFVGKTARTAQTARFWSSLAINLSTLVQQLVVVGVVVAGVYRVAGNEMSVGALVAATILAGRTVAPLSGIANTLSRFHQSRIALAALDNTMSQPVERPADRNFVSRPIEDGSLEFRGVTFSYPEAAEPALNGISFAIQPGERVGLIGRVGCGKTTIGRLATGLFTPDEGAVLLDGVDQRQIDPADVRQGVGLVLQDIALFQGSIRDNIAAGNPYADDQAIIRASQLAGADAFIRSHPMGFDAPVGERGQLISGGQRQAIALARTLVANPKILILDEPTSAMDTGSEAQLVGRLPKILDQGQTLIVTTHRTALLAAVDRLIILDAGHIVADGPRDKVLAALQENKVFQANPGQRAGAPKPAAPRPSAPVQPLKPKQS